MNDNPTIKKQKIEFAIVQQRLLKIDYVAKDLEITKDRVVIPQSIENNQEGEPEKVYATDTKDMGLRGFVFSGIQNVRILDKDAVLKHD